MLYDRACSSGVTAEAAPRASKLDRSKPAIHEILRADRGRGAQAAAYAHADLPRAEDEHGMATCPGGIASEPH